MASAAPFNSGQQALDTLPQWFKYLPLSSDCEPHANRMFAKVLLEGRSDTQSSCDLASFED
jgi:hypothetical protein